MPKLITRRLRRRAIGLSTAVAVSLAVLAAAPIAAAADTGYTFGGVVYLGQTPGSQTTAPAGSATVQLQTIAPDGTRTNVQGATTGVDANGRWVLNNQPQRSYGVLVSYTGTERFAKSTLRNVTVGTDESNDVHVSPLHTLSGTVTLGGAPAPAGNVVVDIGDNGSGSIVEAVAVGPGGAWSVSDLANGDYNAVAVYIGATGFYKKTEWASGCQPSDCDKVFGFEDGDYTITPAIDMPEAPWISGTVTVGGAAESGVTVDAGPVADDEDDWSASTITRADGTYQMLLPAAGQYEVYFESPDATHSDELWDDQNPYLGGTPVTVTGHVAGISADLGSGGTLYGTVSSPGFTAGDYDNTDVDVLVQDPSTGTYIDTGDTYDVSSSGGYTIAGLFPGSYRVRAEYDGTKGATHTDSGAITLNSGDARRADLSLLFSSSAPEGSLDAATPGPGSLTVSGWALDPDVTDSIQVAVYVDGVGSVTDASLSRPDIAAAFPGFGDLHGYSATITGLKAGSHTVCTYALDVGYPPKGNTTLGCRTVTVLGGNIIGSVDSVKVTPGAIIVRGWAIDPVNNSSVRISLYGDASAGADWDSSATADQSRPDIGAAYPGYGSAHGFTIVSGAPISGNRFFTIQGSASGVGSTLLYSLPSVRGTANSATLNVPPANPFGSLDVLAPAGPGSATVSGWAIDSDATQPVEVRLYEGAQFLGTTTATAPRSDVAAIYAPFGAQSGYSATLTGLSGGTHSICAFAINQGVGTNSLLGCRSVAVRGGSPIGSLDTVYASGPGTITPAGWALDPDTSAPIAVQFYVDGQSVFLDDHAGDNRPDIGAAFPQWGSAHGFSPTIYGVPDGTHTLCAYGINAPGTSGSNALLGCRSYTLRSGSPAGSLDSASATGTGAVSVTGWAIDPDYSGSIEVRVYVDGAYAASLSANVSRPDVGAAWGIAYGSNHGFSGSVSVAGGRTHTVCAYGIDQVAPGSNSTLGCRTVTSP